MGGGGLDAVDDSALRIASDADEVACGDRRDACSRAGAGRWPDAAAGGPALGCGRGKRRPGAKRGEERARRHGRV